jgi:glycosyltransferase involved in cell wall biosynthesis
MEPLISIIVPVYNVELYLDKCISSIVNQTYKNLEIILVDNGSPDACPQMCDLWSYKDSRIKVIHQSNAGVSAARNAGLEIFSGEYLMFVDSDDYLHQDAVRVLYERIATDGTDMVVGNAVCVDESGEYLQDLYVMVKDALKNQDEILQDLGGENSIPCCVWGKLYRRAIFEFLRFNTGWKYAEDLLIFIDILKRCTNVSLVSEVLYYYVQRQTSLGTH